MHVKHVKICHCYAEIVKFELILTHLKLFWGQNSGQEFFSGGMQIPHAPLWHHHQFKSFKHQFLKIKSVIV